MSSSNQRAQRGFIPPQNDREKLIMKRVDDLCRIAESRGIARYTGFLSDREQMLAQAALNRNSWQEYSFEGGLPNAERKLLCIKPADSDSEPPICCIRIKCAQSGSQNVSHKDYLGSLLGLGLERSSVGDILPFDDGKTKGAYVAVLESTAEIICSELCSVGRLNVRAEHYDGPIPSQAVRREVLTATVSSLRGDAVIAAMLHCGRGRAAQLLSGGTVEINHIVVTSAHTPVYEGDVFTIRGIGRYKLTALGGKSRKDRLFIKYFKY
ncbi:RNA-binding S4 domain protein [gut metagenome]|uniref:RNA-binding S4 domain protein n=1 Tax=gut metagenome TaxID=749906 RepID=J9GJZ5_9ZZZZ